MGGGRKTTNQALAWRFGVLWLMGRAIAWVLIRAMVSAAQSPNPPVILSAAKDLIRSMTRCGPLLRSG